MEERTRARAATEEGGEGARKGEKRRLIGFSAPELREDERRGGWIEGEVVRGMERRHV